MRRRIGSFDEMKRGSSSDGPRFCCSECKKWIDLRKFAGNSFKFTLFLQDECYNIAITLRKDC